MTDENQRKEDSGFEDQLAKLEKENKRLIEENTRLKNEVIDQLKAAIESAEKMNGIADETIQTSAKAAELAYQTEQSAIKVAGSSYSRRPNSRSGKRQC